MTSADKPTKRAAAQDSVLTNLPAAMNDIDERQLASWMKQAAAMPGFGGKKG